MTDNLEELIEEAYWDFDGRRKSYGEWKNRPQSERDAFKAVLRNFISLEPQFSESPEFLFTSNHPMLTKKPLNRIKEERCSLCNSVLVSSMTGYIDKKFCPNKNCF